jgi:hypothetical protein
VIRDYFTTLPFVNQGFSTVELPFPNGAGQVNLNYTGSAGIILVYVNAPTLLMISGGLINYPEIYALPTTIENQGSIIGVARTFNAGAGLGYTTDGNIATLNNQGVLSIGGDTGSILLGPSLSMTGQTLNVEGIGTIDALIGTVSTSIATLNAGANISFSGTSPELTISSSGGSVSGTIGIEYAGTLYPTIAAGANTTLTPGGSTLTVSASGGGGTASSGGLFSGVLASQPTNPPTTASMAFNTWTNQGGATFANGLQGVLMYNSTVGGNWNFKSKTAPSVPFTATVGLIFANPSYYNEVGFGFIDSAGKLQIIALQVGNSAGALEIFLQEWTNYTTFSTNVVSAGNTGVFTSGLVFLRVNVTSTTVTFSYSGDGEVFFTLFSAAISGGYLANYTTLFLGINVSAVPGVTASFVYYND